MTLFGWWKRDDQPPGLAAWRKGWNAAVETPDGADIDALRRELDAAAAAGADVEIELEMLDGLMRLRDMRRQCSAGALPRLATQHRVVGAEPCHFTAPASLPLDEMQAAGRVLATPTRAIFIGGGRTSASPWHGIRQVTRVERDLVLLRADHSVAAHFRFNTYGDALVAAELARHFAAPRDRRL
ncbi:MAG TPA: hypothetical protein VM364_00910 [Vicinamibacterales bacterium]|nr:hypothetical protein [Vicinamibacterales bacterium]